MNLDKVDEQKYHELLKDRLNPVVTTDMLTESVNTLVETITDILVKTAEEYVPKRKGCKPVKKNHKLEVRYSSE